MDEMAHWGRTHGGESVHAHLMNLERMNKGIPNEVDRLRYIVREHMLESDPSLTCLRPAAKKRKLRYNEDSSSDEGSSESSEESESDEEDSGT